MEEGLRRVIKRGCSLRSKPVVAAQLGPVSQVRDTAALRAVCSPSTLNFTESVFVSLPRVNERTTKGGWKFCSAFSQSELLLRCSEPASCVALPAGGRCTKNSRHLVPLKQTIAFLVSE